MHIQSYFKKGGERMKWKIIALLLVAVLISGCGFHQENKDNQKNENYYKLNTDTTISNYEKLSNDGIDYIYPNFLSRKWSVSKQLERESSMKVNKANDAEFYVIRKNYLNFLNKVDKSLDGHELKSCMQEEIKKYLGSLTPEDSKMNYVNNIKFYDEYGVSSKDNVKKYYYMISFQSDLEIPSVGHYKVPTLMIVKYSDKNDMNNVKEMFENMKSWMLKAE